MMGNTWMHAFRNIAADAMVIKHQAISNHNTYTIVIVLNQFHPEASHLKWTNLHFEKKWPSYSRVNVTL